MTAMHQVDERAADLERQLRERMAEARQLLADMKYTHKSLEHFAGETEQWVVEGIDRIEQHQKQVIDTFGAVIGEFEALMIEMGKGLGVHFWEAFAETLRAHTEPFVQQWQAAVDQSMRDWAARFNETSARKAANR